MKPWVVVLVFVTCLFLTACKNKLQLNDKGVPETLVIGVFAGDDPQRTGETLEVIGKYLRKKLNVKKVEIVKTADYTAVIEALHARKVHMAYLSPFSYVLACRKADLQPLVNIGVHGRTRSYRSVIITHKRTGLKSLDDVKARAKDLSICFSDPASTSGHLIPASYLTSIGLPPQTAFKQKLFASSHGASVMTVFAGKVDVGCAWDLAVPLLVKRGIAKEDDLVTLWKSEPIVSDPIVIRKDLNKEFINQVLQAYLDLPTEIPQAFDDYLTMYYTDTKDYKYEYVVAYDSMYDGIRRIEASMKEGTL